MRTVNVTLTALLAVAAPAGVWPRRFILLNAMTALAAAGVGWPRSCLASSRAFKRTTGSVACTGQCLSRRGPPLVSIA